MRSHLVRATVSALLLALLFAFPYSAFSATPTFTTKDYPAGASPGKMVTSDFNRDGVTDIAVVNNGVNSISVLLGNSDGSFRPPITVATAATAGFAGIATGDLNGDGIPDLVGANGATHSVSVMLGNGDGTFKGHRDFPVPTTATVMDVAVGDFNTDGKLDVAVASGKVFYLPGNGDGTLGAALSILNPPFGAADLIVSGDFNGDGRTDLFYTDCCDPEISAAPVGNKVFLINGGGGQFNQTTISTADVLVLGTLNANGDNLPDISDSYSGCHTPCRGGEVYIGQGGATFPPGVANFVVAGPDDSIPGNAVGADFDGDGKIDLAYSVMTYSTYTEPFGTPSRRAVLIQPGTGGAAWSNTQIEINVGAPARAVFGWTVTGDFNGDGKPDLAVANPDTGVVTVMLNSTGLPVVTGDFGVSLSSQSGTVQKGQSATTTVTINPQNGFASAVSFSCANLPAGASCTFEPATVTPSGGVATTKLTIKTTGPSASLRQRLFGGGIVFALFGIAVVGSSTGGRRKKLVVALGVLALVAAMIACGGVSKNNSNPTPSPTPNPPTPAPAGGTPAGSYTVTVNASSGNVKHAANYTLTVQ